MNGLDASMFDLFRDEAKAHADTLATGLVAVETRPTDPVLLDELMRAAHSIKGAARIVGIDTAVRLAHVMEDALVAAQGGRIRLGPADIDVLLRGADVLAGLAALGPNTTAAWEEANRPLVDALEPALVAIAQGVRPETFAEPPREPPPAEPAKPVPAAASLAVELPEPPAFEPAGIPGEPFALRTDHSMLDLFREEAREHLRVITKGLPHLSSDPTATEPVQEALKLLRGAARLVKCVPVADAAAAMSAFVRTARETGRPIPARAIEWAQYTTATLAGALATDDDTFSEWIGSAAPALATASNVLTRAAEADRARGAIAASVGQGQKNPSKPPAEHGSQAASESIAPPPSRTSGIGPGGERADGSVGRSSSVIAVREPRTVTLSPPPPPPAPAPPVAEPVVRVSAQSLNRLMGLAGESLVQARWLPTFSTALLKMKKRHDLLTALIDTTYHAALGGAPADQVAELVADTRRQWLTCRQELTEQTASFDDHAARAEDLNARLYREVIVSRMRPFGDGLHGLPRMVRDIARALGKEARLVVVGEGTEVDRDILEKLEAPLAHLIRNAVDHGLEMPDLRRAAEKPVAGTVTVEARHRAGMLLVTVSDNGAGVDLNRLRAKIVERGLNSAEMAVKLSDAELLEFLFLPGFSTAAAVTEFSGRGVGLDVVLDTIRKVGGNVRITTTRGKGTTFHLQLPLTLSVIRAVVVDVAGEPYAFPHTRIDRLIRVRRDEVRSIEHRQFVTVDGQNVGLVVAGQLLDMPAPPPVGDDVPVVLLSDGTGTYGLVVDAFRGEQDLVVRPLDPRLGKVPNLSAAAILDDGAPVLIVDVEDLFRSMDQFIQTGSLVRCETRPAGAGRKKRVLVVDDSITVREVERQLLLHKGYDVAVAVDGVDGWNKVRAERCDLLVSDIDMPRMNGLQLVQAVRADDRLRDLPVIIVSYKEREEDRLKGLEVGANAYLTKSSFHDNRFIETVAELIGAADGP
ncbi:Gliding motility regulatory protein [Gemmata obscuriglobus]|uniref:histidine kinase n=1 Tax=Gemmata obscuriglobus TaxID=114 RepID=A0A2Z3GRT5_9BACT|nr:hybrid sensor histidine kinase/response regulator [Gemmata obscuriglobus]AWM36483.1 hybrid sensor histidine kinase/response regulator [Gemmata obscuriglobus]QEG30891.1 Gliding motility regulatory protein [Gemmata obscuriglobus]VTS10224.1 signal transduction histidine kinase : CheA signal transduction histidine kinase OS=Pseudanabaena biceps PCC 7429 GN=Pse7429DRAFT_2172 PE=4 SV=1: Hpt: HATPase_c: CheW: Response_reg [Gemmata obscuriglobus UQM 2246]